MKKKKLKISLFATAIIIIVAIVFSQTRTKVPEFSSTTVERTTLVQSVEETGAITASNDVTYGFELNGKVVNILKKVGDTVSSTDLVASLNSTTQQSSLAQAQAAVAQAQAALNLEVAGPSSESRLESLAKVSKAIASLDQAKIQLNQVQIQNTTKTNQAERDLETAESDLRLAETTDVSSLVSDAVSDLFNSLQASIPTISDGLRKSDNILGIDNTIANDDFEEILGSLNDSTIIQAKSNYTFAKNAFSKAQLALTNVSNSLDETSVKEAKTIVSDSLNKTRNLLTSVKSVLDATVRGSNLTQAQLDTLKADIVTELTNTNTKITDVTNKNQAVDEAKNSLQKKQITYQKAKDGLTQTFKQAEVDEAFAQARVNIEQSAVNQAKAAHDALVAPPRNVDVASLKAELSKQAAIRLSAMQEVEKTMLKAITNGVIANLDINVGDTITANSDIVTIISSDRTIEVDVSETDIAKVTVGDVVEITLDAFGDDKIFNGVVRAIEPAETEISGVIYYHTDVTLLSSEEMGIRPGMTANIKIVTDTKENVLVIPQRAITREEGKEMVKILTNKSLGKFVKKEIQTGIRGDDGMIEVISGLNEGDEIITFLKSD